MSVVPKSLTALCDCTFVTLSAVKTDSTLGAALERCYEFASLSAANIDSIGNTRRSVLFSTLCPPRPLQSRSSACWETTPWGNQRFENGTLKNSESSSNRRSMKRSAAPPPSPQHWEGTCLVERRRERERGCQSVCVLPALPLNLITV